MRRLPAALSLATALVAACSGADDGPDNQAPVVVDDEAAGDEDTTITVDVLANDRDPDGDSLRISTASAVDAPGSDVRVEARQRVTVTPARNFNGPIEIRYRVNDGAATREGRAVVTVRPVNDTPEATPSSVATGRNVAIAVPLAGRDLDGDALTFEVAASPINGALSGTAPDVRYTPANNFVGTDTFTFRARDASAASEPATITVEVIAGAPPVAEGQTLWTLEDNAKAVTLVATDADGDALTYTITQPPQHGTLTGAAPNLTYTPAPDYTGSDVFRWTASDGVLTSPVASVHVEVTADNDRPVADGQSVTTPEDIARAIVLVGHDPENAQLTYTIVDAPAHGTLSSGTGATRTYTPAANFHGVDAFTFTVSDGFITSAPATVSIGVDSVPDVPVAAAQTVAATEDTNRTIMLAGTDGDGDDLTYAVTSGPAHGTIASSGTTVTYTPAANYNGVDAITFTVSDLDHTSQAATVAITVAAVDDVPVIAGATMTGPEGEFIVIPVPATDADGEVLTYNVATFAPHGNLYLAGPERFYREWGHYHGLDSFALTATDGHTTTAPATFTVTVTPTPDAPVARADLAVATPGQALRLDVIANDFEFDDEPIEIDSVTAPMFGTVAIDDNELVYTPAAGNVANDTFTYTVSDPGGLTGTATVTIGIGEFPSGLAPRLVRRVTNSVQIVQQDVSKDGRYVAFLSHLPTGPGDTNGVEDVYVWDRMTETYERISVDSDEALANGASERPSISGDGRYVAFASAASNLVPGDTNGTVDVFVRDRVTGTTVRASVGPSGQQVGGVSRDPDLSDDGRVVAFSSTSFQIIADDANGVPDIFVRDLAASTTTRASIRSGGGEGDFASSQPALSGDGRVVAFASNATNLVSGDLNNRTDVFVHDRTSGVTERVSVSSNGVEANNHSTLPALSYDGRFVAFRTSANNLVPGSTQSSTLVRDRQGLTTTYAAGYLESISLSGDGRYLVGHSFEGACLVRDRFAAVTHNFSTPSGNDIYFPVISRNGRYVAFISNAQLVPPGGTNGTNLYLFANPL
ncbi:MAG TPA: Ig-like domain-containing protein [Kofleriaceae bacterium]|nr:Ig-like domain-containing protein [Kofleriaceae bacterium]